MNKVPKPVAAINVCGAIGYMLLLAVWVLFAAVVVSLLLETAAGGGPIDLSKVPESTVAKEPGPTMVVASYVITAVMVLVCVGVVATLPYLIGKWGSRFTRVLMRLFRVDITRRQLFFVKCILTVLPLIGLLVVNFVIMPEGMTFAALYGATVALAMATIGLFFLQLWLARRFNVPVDRVW